MWLVLGHQETFSGLRGNFHSAIRLEKTDRGDAVSGTPGLKEVLGVLGPPSLESSSGMPNVAKKERRWHTVPKVELSIHLA